MREEIPHVLEFLRSLPYLARERRTYLFIIDGLGSNRLLLPKKEFIRKRFETVFPSSTPTFFYSFHSLLPPHRHGYLEWYMRFGNLREPVTIPPWETISGQKLEKLRKNDVFPFKSLSQIMRKKGLSVCYYTPYTDSVFTKAVSRGAKLRKIRFLSEVFPLEDVDFSFIYWHSADAILHQNFGRESFDAEISMLSFYTRLLWKKIPKKSRLIVISDHGQTEIKKTYTLPLIGDNYPVGGGRVAFYKGVALEDVERAFRRRRIPARIYSIFEIFGTKKINKRCIENFGETVALAERGIGFRYPFEELFEKYKLRKARPRAHRVKLLGHHGGVTKEEKIVNAWFAEK